LVGTPPGARIRATGWLCPPYGYRRLGNFSTRFPEFPGFRSELRLAAAVRTKRTTDSTSGRDSNLLVFERSTEPKTWYCDL
jgi:hypothetical protein